MEDTESARIVNPFSHRGAFRTETWAEIFGVQIKALNDLFRRAEVPVKRIGDTYWATPDDVWSAFPFNRPAHKE